MRRATSFWTSLWFTVVVGLAMGVLPLRPAAAAVGSVTAFTIDSEQGDWVGAGNTYTFTPSNANVIAAETFGGGVSLRASNTNHFFSAVIRPPTGQSLQPGTYDATRFATATTAGLDVVGDGRGCNDTVGTVTIHDVSIAPLGVPQTFAVSFVQYCGTVAAGPALFGELRYSSSIGFAAAEATPSFRDIERVGLMTRTTVPIVVANTGTLPLGLGQAEIGGSGSASFALLADGCSGTTLHAGSACAVDVGFTPADVTSYEATVTIPDTTTRGARSILLRGEGTRFGTTVTLSASSLRVRYGNDVRLTAHLKQFEAMPGAELTILATPHGEVQRTIAAGSVDVNGDLGATFRMRKETTFVARYAGDAAHLADASPARIVQVKPIAKGRMTKYDATSGKYRLYRFTTACPGSGRGCPTYAGTVIPAHPGKTVYGTLQLFVRGAWRTALTFRMRLDSNGNATTIFIYRDRGIIGVPTRVRFEFPGDADHLEAVSRWSYFKVTS